MKSLALLLLGAVCCLAYDPTEPYVIPTAYYASVEFQIPYIQFVEPLTVFQDSNKGQQRFDFYSGTDITILSTSDDGYDYQLIPVDNVQTCLVSNSSGTTLQAVFPDVSKFTYQAGQTAVITTSAYPQGIKCDVWFYSYGTISADPNDAGNSTYMPPDAEGYSGNYTFYRSAIDGTPVRFHLMGHNVVLGGSHSDEYIVDYLQISTLSEVPDGEFSPPSGMPCHSGQNPFGPTYWYGNDGTKSSTTRDYGVVRSNPADDVLHAFPEGDDAREAAFADYERAHGKKYNSKEEREARKMIFHSNKRYINAANRKGRDFHLSLNHLADRTETERVAMAGYKRPKSAALIPSTDPNTFSPINTACGQYTVSGMPQPDGVDWRTSCPQNASSSCVGMVLPPKDQGTCGSCWTYGTTGAIEAAVAYKTGMLNPLSQQSIVDCTWDYGVSGCGGGGDYVAYAWLMQKNGGNVATADSYGPYLSQDGYCHYDLSKTPPEDTNPWTGAQVQSGAVLDSCWHVTKQWNCSTQCVSDEEAVDALSDALATGHVLSVAIDATNPDFYYYHSGYFYSDQCLNGNDDLDHQVLAVGYTNGPAGRYTIIKNSWSTHWGEGGFVNIAQKNNCCGVGTQPTFVIV